MKQLIGNSDFSEIIKIIKQARERALKSVNAEMINMYWQIGEYLSELCKDSSFGDKVIEEVASYIAKNNNIQMKLSLWMNVTWNILIKS